MSRLTENLNLQRGLLRHLDQFPDVQLIEKTRVKSILRDTEERGGWPLVHLDNGRVLRARLLVGHSALQINSPMNFGLGGCRWIQLSCPLVCTDTLFRLVV